jgi:hypothetical protein
VNQSLRGDQEEGEKKTKKNKIPEEEVLYSN